MTRFQYYGVQIGFQTGAFDTWEEVQAVTRGYEARMGRRAWWKGFHSLLDAQKLVDSYAPTSFTGGHDADDSPHQKRKIVTSSSNVCSSEGRGSAMVLGGATVGPRHVARGANDIGLWSTSSSHGQRIVISIFMFTALVQCLLLLLILMRI